MPRDSNGNYSLPNPPVVGGDVIDAGDFNDTMDDLATALQDSLSRSGKGGMQVAFEFADGTVGAPAITWTNETSAGFYRISAGEFGYSVGGSKVLNINASGIDGVVGATNPAAGSFTSISFDDVGSNWTNAGRTIADLGVVTTADINGGTLDGVAIGATTPAAATVTTFTSNGIDDNATSTQLTITDTVSTFGGNVTIPVGSAGSPSLNFSGDTDTGLYRIGANNLGIATGGTLRVNVDSVGKLTYTNNIAGNDGSEGIPSYVFASDNDTGMYKVSANTLGFSTGGTKRLELDSVGKATFGGTLNFYGIRSNTAGSSPFATHVGGGGTWNFRVASSGSSLNWDWNSSRVARMLTNGDWQNVNNSYGAISDRAVKQDITDASSQWDDIKAIQLRNFRYINEVEADENAKEHLGVIAQEVQEVSAGLVTQSSEEEHLGVNYMLMCIKAVGALQEAMTKIEDLEARVATLESAE